MTAAATKTPPLPWPMPSALRASIALHALAGLAAAAVPSCWPWALGAVAANHLGLSMVGLWPRSHMLGPNITKLPPQPGANARIALTFDDGPHREVTPALLDLLDLHGLRATFFCIARCAAGQPALAREIVRRGHGVENHSARHSHGFSLLGPKGFEAEIRDAQNQLADITGVLPRCFRAPAGLRNPFLDPVLHRLDLHLVSWTRRAFDTRCADPAVVARRLGRGLAPGDILLLHDGHGARMPDGRAVVLAAMPLLAAAMRQASLRSVLLADALPRRHALQSSPAAA